MDEYIELSEENTRKFSIKLLRVVVNEWKQDRSIEQLTKQFFQAAMIAMLFVKF